MTRFVIDAAAAVRLASEGLGVPSTHSLVAPNLLRSQALSLVYRAVRAGEMDDAEARSVLDRVTTTKVRLLGDRVSRATAFTIAREQGWQDTADAEYVAVARPQADALVALDDGLARRAAGLVPLAGWDDLLAE